MQFASRIFSRFGFDQKSWTVLVLTDPSSESDDFIGLFFLSTNRGYKFFQCRSFDVFSGLYREGLSLTFTRDLIPVMGVSESGCRSNPSAIVAQLLAIYNSRFDSLEGSVFNVADCAATYPGLFHSRFVKFSADPFVRLTIEQDAKVLDLEQLRLF